MTSLCGCSSIASAAAVLALCSLAPAAEHGDCVAPLLHVTLPAEARWSRAADELTTLLRGAHHLDLCASVLVERSQGRVVVRVNTSDGRHAAREVAEPEDLARTVEALLLLPPPAGAEKNVERAAPRQLPVPPRPAPAPAAAPVGVSIGAGAMARLAGRPLYAGGGLALFATIGWAAWRLDLDARWDVAEVPITVPPPAGLTMQSEAIRLALGRALAISDAEVELLAGPCIVFESQEAIGPGDGLGGETTDLRLSASLRLSVPRDAPWRFFAEADLEGSPSRLVRPRQLDRELPRLPAWSAGLSSGVKWRSP